MMPTWMNDAIAKETAKFSELIEAVERTEDDYLRDLLGRSLQAQENRVITVLELREHLVQQMFEGSKS